MRKVTSIIMVTALLLTACSVKRVERMQVVDGAYWITISDIGPCRVKVEDYIACQLDDYIHVLGFAYGQDYYRVKCWR